MDSLTSNIGHLLGTGLLDAEEERLVAELVSGPELDSGLGLRTMAATDGGYAPLSYHCGSVWPHDTAIVIAGLIRSGLTSYATGLVEGTAQGVGGLRPAVAGAVVRRGAARAVSDGLSAASLVGRRRRAGPGRLARAGSLDSAGDVLAQEVPDGGPISTTA